jgi:hypothetical protein
MIDKSRATLLLLLFTTSQPHEMDNLANLESRKNAKRNLIYQFQALPVPSACPFLLLHWANCGRDSDTREPYRSDYQEDRLVDTLFNFDWEWITRSRTDEELHALVTSTRTRSPEARRTHEHVDGESQQDRLHNIAPGWCMLGSCLYPVLQADLEDIRPLHELHLRQRWPRSLRTFLPRGPALALQGILQWLKFTSNAKEILPVLGGLDHFVQLVRSSIVPHLVLSRAFKDGTAFMWKQSSRMLGAMLDKYSRGSKQEDEMIALYRIYSMFIGMIYDLLPGMSEMERKVFHHYMVTELLGMYEGACCGARKFRRLILLYRSEDPQNHRSHPLVDASEDIQILFHNAKHLAQQLYSDCPNNDAFDLSNEAHSLLLEHDKSGVKIPPVAPVRERLVRELSLLQDRQQCFAPACQRTRVDCRMRLCMGCRRVSYCSRRCQKKAWTHESAAHRDVYAILAKIRMVHGTSTARTPTVENIKQDSLAFNHIGKVTLLKLRALNPDSDFRLAT